MPTYEYECTACEHSFEAYQSITAKPMRKCPACGQRKVIRLIGAGGGVIFKGSGFYITDNRKSHDHPPDENKTEKLESDKKPQGN